nr:MAG TPA: hypothetical protein [Caudoviricetes sp.]
MVHSIRFHGFRYVRRCFNRSFVTQHPRAAVLDCQSRAVLYAFLLCVNNSKSVFTLWSEAESNRRNHPRLRRKKKAGDSKNQNASPYNPWCPSHLPALLKTRLSSQICELTEMFYHQ